MDGININFDVNALMDKFSSALSGIASKLGTTGETLLGYAVRGKVAEGVAEALTAFGGVVLACLSAYYLPKLWSRAMKVEKQYRNEGNYYPQGVPTFGMVVLILICVVSSASMIFCNVQKAVMNIMAPQYMLIRDVIDLAKNVK